jgi:hypothetical protein
MLQGVRVITKADIAAHKESGPWRRLQDLASLIVTDAEESAKSKMHPLLGGGTRIMLALDHRISDDIDLFIRDPQWIGYLSPRLNDTFEQQIASYEEGATSLKLEVRKPGMEGEIDFIVGMSLLGLPEEHSELSLFQLEPVAEVLAKKLFYRGSFMTARDLFDWWSIEKQMPSDQLHLDMLSRLLQPKLAGIANALSGMRTSAEFKRKWDGIRAASKPDLDIAILWASGRLKDMQATSQPTPLSAYIPPRPLG